ncbi:MAG: hypothetical protein HYR96_15460 [Deltaproteobacteria bacterium]|nr:hypothetical protein [Deltaproteobacteria bacterium]MBI3294506.1 hypothetical protein [Deltaproteobacteria bacterium]
MKWLSGKGPVTTVVRVKDMEVIDGKVAFKVSGILPGNPDFYPRWDNDGNGYDYSTFFKKWVTTMQLPIETGHRWYNGVSHYIRWGRKFASVQYGKHTFEDCWERIQEIPSGDITDIYCPGVGMVRSSNAETAKYGTIWELILEDFHEPIEG